MSEYRRRLPHLQPPGQPVFVTWRLAGTLPDGRAFPPGLTGGRQFVAMDRLLDEARTGPTHLKHPEVARIVVDTINAAEDAWEVHSYVVMPNHVHLLVTPAIALYEVLRQIKGRSARGANLMLGLTGTDFWQRESYDHLVRNETEFGRISRYIEMNPVRAGLARDVADYRWSSAVAGLEAPRELKLAPRRSGAEAPRELKLAPQAS